MNKTLHCFTVTSPAHNWLKMTKLFAMLAVASVCGSLTFGFVTIPKYNKKCLPPNATLVKDFKPDQLFNGKNLYVVAGPPSHNTFTQVTRFSDDDPTCFSLSGAYDAGSNIVNLTSTLIINGISNTDQLQLTKDVDSDAVYDDNSDGNDPLQLFVLDTDYVTYAVYALCSSDQVLAVALVASRTPRKPANYDSIVAKLAVDGFPTDSEHLSPFDTSDC